MLQEPLVINDGRESLKSQLFISLICLQFGIISKDDHFKWTPAQILEDAEPLEVPSNRIWEVYSKFLSEFRVWNSELDSPFNGFHWL